MSRLFIAPFIGMSQNIIKITDKIIGEAFLFRFQTSGKFIIHSAHFHSGVLARENAIGHVFEDKARGTVQCGDLLLLSDKHPEPVSPRIPRRKCV